MSNEPKLPRTGVWVNPDAVLRAQVMNRPVACIGCKHLYMWSEATRPWCKKFPYDHSHGEDANNLHHGKSITLQVCDDFMDLRPAEYKRRCKWWGVNEL